MIQRIQGTIFLIFFSVSIFHAQYQIDGNNCDASGSPDEWPMGTQIFSATDGDDTNTAGADIEEIFLSYDEPTETFCFAFQRFNDGSTTSGPTSTYAIFFDTDCDTGTGATDGFNSGADAALGFIWQQNNILDVEAFFFGSNSSTIVSSVYQGQSICGDPNTDGTFAEFCASTLDLAGFLNFDPCGCAKISITGVAVLAGGSFNSEDKDDLPFADAFCVPIVEPSQAIATGTITAAGGCSGEVNINYEYTGGTIPIPSISWDFDGNGTTDSTSPSGTYNIGTAGSYTATLTVVDTDGCEVSSEILFSVDANEPPVANKVVSGDPCTGMITFDGSSSVDNVGLDNLTYLWEFGDGSTSSLESGSIILSDCNLSDVTLTVTDPDVDALCNQDVVEMTVDMSNVLNLNCPAPVIGVCDLTDDSPYTNLTDFIAAGGTVSNTANCSLSFEMISEVIPTNACVGIVMRTYQISDDCGNTATCEHLISINDDTPPEFTVPVDIELVCPGDAPGAGQVSGDPTDLTITGEPIAISDNCTNVTDIMITFEDNYDLVSECTGGILRRTWIATDLCDNVNRQTQTIVIAADELPPLDGTFPANVTLDCECVYPYIGAAGDPDAANCSAGTAIPEPPAGGAIDICFDIAENSDYTDDLSGFNTCNNSGVILRTWRIYDFCGVEKTKVQTIIIEDNEDPTIDNTPAAFVNITCLQDPNDLSLTGEITSTDVSDNCSTNLTIERADVVNITTCSSLGSITRTWTLTDNCTGITDEFVQIIMINSAGDVDFDCPSQIDIDCAADPDNTSVTGTPVLNDAVCFATVSFDYEDTVAPGICVAGNIRSVISRRWFVISPCGDEVGECFQTINLIDNQAPTFIVPADIVLECDQLDLDPSVAPTTNLSGMVAVSSIMDNCATSDFDIAYVDNPPRADLTGCNGTGVITRTWTVTDACGNATSQNQSITIQDTEAPDFTVPTDVTVNCDDQIFTTQIQEDFDGTEYANLVPVFTLTGEVEDADVTDNCRTSNFYILSTDDFSNLNQCNVTGFITRTWIVGDRCGNNTEKTQKITVQDNEQPTFEAPADQTVECNSNIDFLTLLMPLLNPDGSYQFVVAPMDNCQDENFDIEYSDDLSGLNGCAGTGSVIRTWTVRDACGNFLTDTQIIGILDTTDPSFVLPDDITISCEESNQPANTGMLSMVDDLCSDTDDLMVEFSDVADFSDPMCPYNGKIIRTWTVTDECGNDTEMDQTITIQDITPPMAVCQDITVDLSGGGPVIILPISVNNGSSDNCTLAADLTFTLSKTEFSCDHMAACTPTEMIVLTVTDECGNASTCDVTVTFIDNPPMIDCPPNPMPVQLGPGECRAQVFFDDPVYSDDCTPYDDIIFDQTEGFTTNISGGCIPDEVFEPVPLLSGSFFEIGITTITWEVTDCRGNKASCSIQIEVLEHEAQLGALACNDLIKFTLDDGCCHLVTADELLEGSDNIGCVENYDIEITNDAGISYGNLLTSTMVGETLNYTFTDPETGNSCWGKLLVEDKIAPELNCTNLIIDCNVDTHPLVIGGLPSADPNQIFNDDGTITLPGGDNCGDATLSYIDVLIELDCPEQGYLSKIIRTWTAIDAHGRSSICEQLIFIEPSNEAVVFPPNYDGIDQPVLECENFRRELVPGAEVTDSIGWWDLESGLPNPESHYYPAPNGEIVKWYGTGFPTGVSCGKFQMDYTDDIIEVCDNTRKVLRHWTVLNWCTGEILKHTQLIKIEDNDGPLLACPEERTIGLPNAHTCQGDVELDPPRVIFDCSDNLTYTVAILFANEADQAPANGNYEGDQIRYDITEKAAFTNLPLGRSWVRYTVYDDCDNSNTCFTELIVVDDIGPTAVCDDQIVVSLTSEGITKIMAESFDDGSHDACDKEVFFKTFRTAPCDANHELFNDYVKFCCKDINAEIMVRFRVYDIDPGPGEVVEDRHQIGGDLYGHFNDCMVTVNVQDKTPPSIICPPNITVSCEHQFFGMNEFGEIVTKEEDRKTIYISDPSFIIEGAAKDGIAIANCGNVDVEELESIRSNNLCGRNTITRSWRATDDVGQSTVCTQVITILSDENIVINDTNCNDEDSLDNIIWPCDFQIDACELGTPITDESNSPELVGAFCVTSNVAITHSDELYQVGDGCGKIIRTWNIIDWCAYDGDHSSDGYWEYTQTISVKDNVDPVIQDCGTVSICIETSACQAPVNYRINATDDCASTEQLRYSFAIDLYGDGSYDIQGQNAIQHNLPLGSHKVKWTVKDQCNNKSICTQDLHIVDCKAPFIYCQSAITTAFMIIPGQDPMIDVWASDIVLQYDDNCGEAVNIGISKLSDNPNYVPSRGQNIRIDCSDVQDNNMVPVQVWAFDQSGNSAYCDAFVNITFDIQVCENLGSQSGNITGYINTENDNPVSATEVYLMDPQNQEMVMSMTNDFGVYSFDYDQIDEVHHITPKKDTDYRDGVSTLDLVLLQRHILGIQSLDSPYKIIAADANNNQSISASDLVIFRKLILGLIDDLPSNDSWRFVNKEFIFQNQGFPWPFDEQIEMNQDQTLDFVGIKIGDLNNNNSLDNNFLTTENRNSYEAYLRIVERTMLEKGTIELDIYLDQGNLEDLSGIQFQLDVDKSLADLSHVSSQIFNLSKYANVNVADGFIRFSMDQYDSALDSKPLFSILLDTKENVDLKDVLSINDRFLKSEVYDQTANIGALRLDFPEPDLTNSENVLELYQNKPNPFKNNTEIVFGLKESDYILIQVYDIFGRLVMDRSDRYSAGSNTLVISNSDLKESGIYIYTFTLDGHAQTMKMIKTN